MATHQKYLDSLNRERLLDRLTTVDLPAFHRQTVGFDRIFDEIARITDTAKQTNYPPYNVIRTGENTYTIELAVAGFAQEELDVVQAENTLTVKGMPVQTTEAESEWPQYIYKGVARRSFERVFKLADHMEVSGASVINGMLIIELELRIPEEKQPKRIAIAFKDK